MQLVQHLNLMLQISPAPSKPLLLLHVLVATRRPPADFQLGSVTRLKWAPDTHRTGTLDRTCLIAAPAGSGREVRLELEFMATVVVVVVVPV